MTELVLLAERLPPAADGEVWVTFDTPQSRRLLAERQVEFVRDTPPRDLLNVVANVGSAAKILRRYRPDELVTNGAGIALSFAPLAVAAGVRTHYIECSARTEAPSLTGRLLEFVPRVHLYAQDPQFANGRWHYEGSVFDRYRNAVRANGGAQVRKVVVTVGSLTFSFRRLLDRLKDIVPADVDVVVQAGVDDASLTWPGARIYRSLPPDELDREMASADVVVAHSGIGSALAALDVGKSPILVPRIKRFGEHVDDHQRQIARTLQGRGLASMVDASRISFQDLERAASRTTIAQDGTLFELR